MKPLAKKLKPEEIIDNNLESHPLKSDFNKVMSDKHSLVSKFTKFWIVLLEKSLSILMKMGILIVILIITYLLVYKLFESYLDHDDLILTNNSLQVGKSITLSYNKNNDQKNNEIINNSDLNNDNSKSIQEKLFHNVKHQNINLILYIIKDKITLGDNFDSEFHELSAIYPSLEDPNYLLLKQYTVDNHIKIKDILEMLYEEMSNKQNVHPNQNFYDFIKNFFTVKKTEEGKVQASEQLLTKVIIQLLLNGEINSAYLVANKFSDQSESLKKISINLFPINQALIASNQMLRRVMLND